MLLPERGSTPSFSEESQAITALVFALDNSGPAPSEFTQPIVPSVLQPCAQPIHNQ